MGLMNLRRGDRAEIRIEKTAFGGQGLARLDGFVIFVDGAIPGERVTARVVKKKRDYAEATILEVLEGSPDRVYPPCPYAGYCGGCRWQHVRYERQLDFKKEHIKEAMARTGGIPEVQIHDVIPSEKRFAYRNKMEFSFSDRRWLLPHEDVKTQSKDAFALGLHVPGTFYKVIDVEACLLQHETGNVILREVRRYVLDSGIPVYGLKTHQGFWRFLMLRHSQFFDQWMVNLVTSEQRQNVLEPLAEALCRRFPNIKTVVNNINSRRAAIAAGERERLLFGKGHIQDKIGPFCFDISANSFFQTNSMSAERLYRTILEYAELKGTEIVLDLYSGTGTIPIFISSKTKAVVAMEIAESAISDARRNCRTNNVYNCQFIQGDIREELSTLKVKPDVLIIDPPRAGLHKEILAKVMELGADRIIYVSCNPATMARDIGHMSKAYGIVEIQPVDMFPHTYHIEAVAKLVRLRVT
jgi:23S rRNA (uracil1939-C5)-methyltransferase